MLRKLGLQPRRRTKSDSDEKDEGTKPTQENTGEFVQFAKFNGVGNDVIVIDNRTGHYSKYTKERAFRRRLCDRKCGVGADEFCELGTHPDFKFVVKCFDCNGEDIGVSGNALFCAVNFARSLGLLEYNEVTFMAADGPHFAIFDQINNKFHIKMRHVSDVAEYDSQNFFAFTGAPNHVQFVTNLQSHTIDEKDIDVTHRSGYDDVYRNVVELSEDDRLHMRTFKYGAKTETEASSTGAVAAALALATKTCHEICTSAAIEEIWDTSLHDSITEMALQSSGSSSEDSGHGPDGYGPDDLNMLCHSQIHAGKKETTKFCRVFCKDGSNIGVYFTQVQHKGSLRFKDIYMVAASELIYNGTYSIPEDYLYN